MKPDYIQQNCHLLTSRNTSEVATNRTRMSDTPDPEPNLWQRKRASLGKQRGVQPSSQQRSNSYVLHAVIRQPLCLHSASAT
jgi:hypothetical protein